jgi:hypothetical protein
MAQQKLIATEISKAANFFPINATAPRFSPLRVLTAHSRSSVNLESLWPLFERDFSYGSFDIQLLEAAFDDTPWMVYVEEDKWWHHRNGFEHIEIDFMGRQISIEALSKFDNSIRGS